MDEAAGFSRIGIFGLGLIGGSAALAARRAWPRARLSGVDSRDEAVREALRLGVVDDAATSVAPLASADIVLLAAPVLANVTALPALARQAREGAVLTDAGSTKRCIVAAARAAGCEDRFVGGHPVAGSARGGLAHASADLFAGRRWLITPQDDTPPASLARVRGFVGGLGATPQILTAEEHDRVMAAVSHLPQLVVSALMSVAGGLAGSDGLALAGSGLADATRLASSPPDIWAEVCATNTDNIRPALRAVIAALEELDADLPRGAHLARLFDDARRWRDRLGAT